MQDLNSLAEKIQDLNAENVSLTEKLDQAIATRIADAAAYATKAQETDESFLFVWKPGGAKEPAGPRGSQEELGGLFLAIFACFPLVSDGPLVQDLRN